MNRSAFRPLLLAAVFCTAVLSGCATNAPPSAPPAVVPKITAAEPAAPAASQAAPAVAVGEAPKVNAAGEPIAIDPLRPEERVNLDDAAARADLWARVRRGFAMPNLENARVRDSEQWYATRPDYVQRMTERGSRYLFHIVEEVERRGMPTELALLPFIESAFNPQAMSSAQASGMWQFMPGTGRAFALKQNMFRDDRRDVLASTRAALDYLARLHSMFGDWHLALAAYNWGEGNVQRAVTRNQRSGRAADYASLRMPRETQYYVPKLQAVKNIVAKPEAFGLTLPPVANHPYFLSVPITRDIDVDIAARLSGMESEDFKNLNPQMNKPVILAAGTPYVLLPYDNANQFVRAIADHRGPMATWTAWVAPKTLRPAEAAQQIGISEEELREVNHIPPRMLLKAGSTLLVPRAAQSTDDVSEHIADNATMLLSPDMPQARRVTLKAGRRDTVASIARRYRISSAQVAQWNQVSNGAKFARGQTIVVYVANKSTKATSRSVATRKASTKTTRQASVKAPARVTKSARTPTR